MSETGGSRPGGLIGPEPGGVARGNAVEAAWDALRGVYDPELCLDLVSLGLVYDVRDEEGSIVVEMTLTTLGCPASEILPEFARTAIVDAVGPGVGVEVRVVWEPPWNPAMMNIDAAEALGFGRP